MREYQLRPDNMLKDRLPGQGGNMFDWNKINSNALNKFLKKFRYYLLSLDQSAQLQLDWMNV